MKFQYKYSMDKTLTQLFLEAVNKYPDNIIYKYRDADSNWLDITYRDFLIKVKKFAGGLIELGLDKKHMAIVCDNCPEWAISVIANMGLGGVDIPRGLNTPDSELRYILENSDIDFICIQNSFASSQIKKYNIDKSVKKIIFFPDKDSLSNDEIGLDEIYRLGEKYLQSNPLFFEERVGGIKPDDLSTIIYTSGTTGVPKGVMLTHKNLTFAPTEIPSRVTAYENDRWMSILPIWHVGERFFEFMGIIKGVTIILSSMYTVKDDMKELKPHLIPGVPLVWKKFMVGIKKGFKDKGKDKILDSFYKKSLKFLKTKRVVDGLVISYKKIGFLKRLLSFFVMVFYLPFHLLGKALIYSKIVAMTGGEIRTITSGGGKLPEEVDDFFNVLGFNIIDGYGSSETATLVTIRPDKNVKYTIGQITPRTEYKILDEHTNKECGIGEPGILFVKGEQIFRGYYKNEEATKKVLSDDGWYNTGDIVKRTYRGEFVFVGRAKDTIVLLNGENIEPEPIEEAIEDSEYIKHSFVFGQDMEFLYALIVPDFDVLKKDFKIKIKDNPELSKDLQQKEIVDRFDKEIKSRVNIDKGFKNFEFIKSFIILSEDFEVGKELTMTMKKKRTYILEKNKGKIIERNFK